MAAEFTIRYSFYNLQDSDKLRYEIGYAVNEVISSAKANKLWSNYFTSIVVTDNLDLEVHQKSKSWSKNFAVSKSRDYGVISKLLFNSDIDNPEYECILSIQSFLLETPSLKEVLYSQLFQIKADTKIPKDLRRIFYVQLKPSLENYIKQSALLWVKAYYVRSLTQEFLSSVPSFNHSTFLTAFKRELKRTLYAYNSEEYQNDRAIDRFWGRYIDSLQELFTRILENLSDEAEYQLKTDTPERPEVYGIIEEIKTISKQVLETGVLQVEELKKRLIRFSRHYEIILSKETESNFYIEFSKDPKEYFKNEIVDTEPRIVCFMDILGFSDFIQDYDNNLNSSVLQDIQESFSLAKDGLLENPHLNKEAVKHLEYQTFSDNICISIPFFDNQDDFLSNFQILVTYVRGFQYLMMTKGFFTRGGISTGSYYADKNIIFSMGLVKSYLLESKQAVYPRTILDKAVMERLSRYGLDAISQYGLNQTIILDWEKTAFLNPTGILNSSISYLKNVMTSALETEEDEDPLVKTLNNFSRTISEGMVKMLEGMETGEKESYQTIKDHIERNIIVNESNKGVLSKYLWIKELFEWLEGSDGAKLSFEYLNDRLEKEK